MKAFRCLFKHPVKPLSRWQFLQWFGNEPQRLCSQKAKVMSRTLTWIGSKGHASTGGQEIKNTAIKKAKWLGFYSTENQLVYAY